MKTVISTDSNVSKLAHDHWLGFFDEDGNATWAEPNNEEAIAKCAKQWGVPAPFVAAVAEAFQFMAEQFAEAAHKDLEDLWLKLNN